jgi:glycosyltransferase 2 family protein
LKKNQLVLGLVVVVAIAGLVIWGHDRIQFDFGKFRNQLALADWRLIAAGVGLIYLAYVVRSIRWAYLLRHNKKVSWLELLGTQVIGFTAIALIGRVADPVRPYLVAKKTGLPLSSQIAVYIVERLFDMGSMALISSLAILLVAWFGSPEAMPHAELVKRSGYGGLLATLAAALFLVAVRFAGNAVAAFFEHTLGAVSKKIGHAAGRKIREFRTGLDTMRSFADFGAAAGISIAMWLLISASYLVTTRAFVASPQLAAMTPTKCVLLMVLSGVSSVVQLPVLFWFTQIGIVAAAIAKFFGVAPEASTACAATLLLVTFLAIIPFGLVWAQFEHVSLRKVTVESEHAEKDLEAAEAAE